MNIFDELDKIYSDIDNQYATLEFAARARGFTKKESQIKRKRELNDHAYFLFMYTRLEGRIQELSTNLINKKSSSLTDYKNKRVWSIVKEKRKLNLMEKVSFFTNFGGVDYILIDDYKKHRNSIAHGGNFLGAVSIPTVLIEFKRLYRELNN